MAYTGKYYFEQFQLAGYIFRVCFNTINVNEYKWFQYRIIHRILGVRSKLYQINISEDDTCQLCKE